MIIDSPIVSGSFLSTGSLSQIGNATITGSLNVSGSGISLTDGTFSGSGANLFNIPAAGIVGLNLSQIASGSVSASIAPDKGLLINTSVSASNFTGSFTGSLTGIATSASYAAFALTSSYSLGGSGFPFSGSAVITGSLIVSGSGVTITGSLAVSTLTTGSGVRYVIADANGLISAQTASAAIFVTQKDVATAGQTSFNVVNGYSTGYVTVFVNGTKLSADEYTDTSGTTIVLATGSMANDVVEFQKYMPAAGVSNNALRQINYFTTTLGQTNFTVNYTPGLLDVFYNGSKLSNVEYTANNGTSITLATGSNSGDTLEVDVYSYQVGAFSGIGGSGAANQLAYFNTTNSITGSNNFTVSGSAIIITGSLIVSGSGTLVNIGPAVFSGSVTAVGGFSGSFSGNADSASLAQNSLLLQGTGSVGFTTTASFNAVSASQQQISSSLLNVISIFATTGSNSFRATQSITGSLTVTGQITAQTLNVQQVTSSIIYSSGSNIFGCDLNSRQTFTGSFYQTGSAASFSNCIIVGGALSGTSATFTGILNVSYATPILRLTDTAATGNNGNVYLRAEKSGVGYNTLNYIGYEHIFKGGGSESTFLTINSAGAATFACSLTAVGNINIQDNFVLNLGYNQGGGATLKYNSNGNLDITPRAGYSTIFTAGNVGIATCIPVVKFQVTQLAGQCMPTLGANCGSVFIAGDTNLYGLYIGNDSLSGNAWLQSMRNNSATAYNILLNPVGGNVAIGTTDAPTKLNMGGYVGSRLPYIDGTSKTFNSIGITVGSYNTGNAIGGGLDLTNNVACVGSYSPILSFSSLSSNSAYNNAYAGIWGIYQGAGGDANWNRGDLVFGTALSYGISERMRITGGGNVFIGTSSAGGALHVVGTGTAFVVGEVGGSAKQLLVGIDSGTGTSELQSVWQGTAYTRLNLNPIAGAVYAGATRLDTLSDARVKDNIQPITGALDKVLSITGKKFHLKDEEEGKIRYGFIAQELEGVLDEFVLQTNMTFKKDDLEVENVKSIDNWASSWSALLVEAIKEQQCKISLLESCLGIA
jgi:Chaperone of endosialidase